MYNSGMSQKDKDDLRQYCPKCKRTYRLGMHVVSKIDDETIRKCPACLTRMTRLSDNCVEIIDESDGLSV